MTNIIEQIKHRNEISKKRELEKKEQVINFIVLMMEEYKIDESDLK